MLSLMLTTEYHLSAMVSSYIFHARAEGKHPAEQLPELAVVLQSIELG